MEEDVKNEVVEEEVKTKKYNRAALASFILGIIGVLTFFAPGIGALLGIISLFLAIFSFVKKLNPKWMKITGLVLGILAIIFQACMLSYVQQQAEREQQEAIRIIEEEKEKEKEAEAKKIEDEKIEEYKTLITDKILDFLGVFPDVSAGEDRFLNANEKGQIICDEILKITPPNRYLTKNDGVVLSIKLLVGDALMIYKYKTGEITLNSSDYDIILKDYKNNIDDLYEFIEDLTLGKI